MNIYILYEHLVREWEAANRIKKALEKQNHRVFIFSALYERNKSYFCSLIYKPDVVFMPWLASDFFEKPAAFFVSRNKNVRIIDFHHEEISEPSGYEYFIPKTIYGKKGAFHIAWGDNFKDLLVKNGVDEDRVFVTGNIRADLLTVPMVSKEYLSQKYNLDSSKKWILFAESRGYYNQRTSKSELKALLNAGTSIKEIRSRKLFEFRSIRSFIEDINSVSGELSQGNKYEFIYRPHPGTDAPEGIPSWVNIISERSISDWISCSDLFISCGSTSIFEAEISGKPCVTYDSYPRPYERMMGGLDHYLNISSLNEINDSLIEEARDSIGNIYESYFGKADGKSVDRIVDMLREITDPKYDSSVKDYSKKICHQSAYELFRHFVYETVIWFLTKTTLLDKTKWPNSAYVMRKDIPYHSENKWIKSVKSK